ncbi:MAG: hypothetical protein HXX15_07955 [Rhodopseudomonas sp.]|uniref:hypothetical protein n=1 Tax=Rhodopseudomonas sp. TaxID=1078 RepID=UPI001841CE8C|nr:hypothetical protein [Rhodopseudomonas sp.]NVN86011.1 hypothetical protein [Rhodopseudomonas sp.]
MKIRNHPSLVATTLLAAGLLSFGASSSASALTAQECSAKYQAAKTAGTLGGQSWNDFRKAQCGSDAAAAPAASDASAPKTAETKSEAKPDKSAAKSVAKPVAAPPSAGPATFPTAVDAKFAKEPAARARLHTCAESWKTNKAANTTGGLRWIQKGGGYWSECNKKLKG